MTKKHKLRFLGILALISLTTLLGGCRTKELRYRVGDRQTAWLYQNPFPINNIGDPFVFRAGDGAYYLFATSAPDGFYCWKSDDLVHWGTRKEAYLRRADSWGVENFWAPEVTERGGRYFLFYSAKTRGGSLRIGAAVSERPDGPYRDARNEPLFDFGYAAIDPDVLQDSDGQNYLFFSRDCSENTVGAVHTSEICGVRLSQDLLSVQGEPIRLTTPEQAWETSSKNPLWNEGPEILKHNGLYYLTYSANCYAGRNYSVGYATSRLPLGPYEKSKNNPILTAGMYEDISGPGHHSFVTSPDGEELLIAYHTHTFPEQGGGNRQLNLDRVIFSESGELHIDGPTISPQPIPSSRNFRNVALEAEFQCSGSKVSLLNDGIFAVHRKDEKLDWVQTAEEDGFVRVTAKWKQPRRIVGVCVYRGVHDSLDFQSLDLMFDGRYQISDVRCPSPMEQRSAAISFDPVSASEINFRFRPEKGQKQVAVSEIMRDSAS